MTMSGDTGQTWGTPGSALSHQQSAISRQEAHTHRWVSRRLGLAYLQADRCRLTAERPAKRNPMVAYSPNPRYYATWRLHMSPIPQKALCIEKQIELKAPVSRVWRALTDYREFGEWFRVKLDGPFVAGQVSRGHITYPGYEHIRWEAVVQKIEPERLFSFTWHPYGV